MRRGRIFTTSVKIFGRRKINPYRLSTDAVLELLDERRADLEPCMRRSRLHTIYFIIFIFILTRPNVVVYFENGSYLFCT